VGFGLWTLLSSVIGFLAAHGEKLILAALLGTAAFGVFSIAALLLTAVVGVYGSLNGHVVFARLSEAVRNGMHDASGVYHRVQTVADWALGLLAGGLLALGPWVVQMLYDPRYAAAGWMLQALALGLVALRHQVIEQLLFALARPSRVTLHNALRAGALLTLVPTGFAAAGERGAVAAVVLSQFAGWPSAWLLQRELGLWRLSAELRWPVALAAGALLGGVALQGIRSVAA
jgi:O-antigen/teichoic acid export membrane protein